VFIRALILSAALLTSGCARKVTGLFDPPAAPAARQTAVAQTMARQIRNASLASAGDPALRILRQRLAVAPEDISIRVEMAAWYERSGQLDLALEHTRLARAKSPDFVDLVLREVRLLEALDLSAEAASVLRSWIAAHPGAPAGVHSRLGILLDNAGELVQGEEAHRGALALAAADDRLHNNLGWNLLLQRRYAEAAGEFEAALRFNARSETARNNSRLARALDAAARGRNPAQAWAGNDDPAALHNNLAAVWIENGRYEEAREELALAIAARRDYLPALRNLRLVAELDGRPASVNLPPLAGRWNRFASALRRAILGPKDADSRNQPDDTASRSASR
jgi:Flp pilus assembly protein TadD